MARSGKKRVPTALQLAVSTDEEWEDLLKRKGLILVDVYSEWSGPCVAMLSTLRKVKMEIAGDAISYAVARNDEIADLQRFRGKSEPVWMFLQDGRMVNLMFGAHCPNLRKLLLEEIRRVQREEAPKLDLPVDTRSPEEEVRWQQSEAIRKAAEEEKRRKEEAERTEKYEEFLAQMMFELCEETALILYPWVFKDEKGNPRDKEHSPPYIELIQDVLRESFDVIEEPRIQLNEELIKKLFVESNVELTKGMILGLTDGKCMAMRLRGRAPPSDWPVPYPQKCPEGVKRCPTRAINDIENYLSSILNSKPTSLNADIGIAESSKLSYVQKHVYTHEPKAEAEDDFYRVYSALWAPPQARSKVHVFKTLFPNYMDVAHPYEEPVEPPPLCAFNFVAEQFSAVRNACEQYPDALEYFGAFESDKPSYTKQLASSYDDLEKKVKHKTGAAVLVVIIRRINEEAFLAFAGIEPYFITENDEEARAIVSDYFSARTKNSLSELSLEERKVDFYEEHEAWYSEEEAEEGKDTEDEENASKSIYPYY